MGLDENPGSGTRSPFTFQAKEKNRLYQLKVESKNRLFQATQANQLANPSELKSSLCKYRGWAATLNKNISRRISPRQEKNSQGGMESPQGLHDFIWKPNKKE